MYCFLIIQVKLVIHSYDTEKPTLRLDILVSKIIFLLLRAFSSIFQCEKFLSIMADLQLDEENYRDYLHSLSSYQISNISI